MSGPQFDGSIRSSFSVLEECRILRSASSLRSMETSEEFRTLALTSQTRYRDLYLCGIRNVDYNFLLVDYAFLQFTRWDQAHYRFAFYPNPFVDLDNGDLADVEAAVNEGILSFEEYSQYISDLPFELRAPIIRFEVDCAAYVMLRHPAAHLHLGMHDENRWPVSRYLTPRAFTLMIAKLFFPRQWWHHGRIAVDGQGFFNAFDRQLADEKAGCALLGQEVFDEKERAQLHFA